MHLAYRLPLCVLLAAACGDDNKSSASATDTLITATGSTTAGPTTGEPTTSTSDVPTTSTTDVASTGGSSSTGAPAPVCSEQTNQADCINADCKWSQVVNYTHGTQGCQGSVRDWCIPKMTSGGLSAVYREVDGDIEVVQFPFNPDDLPPDWKPCDCDGPLACLCTAVPLDCPDRLGEFCGAITSENACVNASASGKAACGYFKVSPEGPADGMCAGDPFTSQCLPAVNPGADTCTMTPLPQYPGFCDAAQDPIFWRDNNGIIEVTKKCGPEPAGWSKCTVDDPNQPDECKCACL